MGRNRGFSLIEVSIVVAIMMVFLTLGLGFITSHLSSAAYSTTKNRQVAIKDALIAHMGAHKQLPCPYEPTAGSPVTGVAPATPCPAFGVVPFATLGLSREIAEDGWGNFFSYRVYRDDPPPACPGSGRNWGVAACFGEGKGGGIAVNDGTVSAPIPLATNIVAVVISHGANGLGAWAGQGTRNAPPTTCEEAHNAVGTTAPSGCTPAANIYFKGERPEIDDVVAYLTANNALQILARQGDIRSPAAKVHYDLQSLYEEAVGLNLDDEDCDVEPSAGRDPWGELYEVTTAPGGGVQFCFYSGGGQTPSLGPNCTCSLPTICKELKTTVLNSRRASLGNEECD